jgi:TatA/E family protein of Tat protein translocase
MFGATGHLPELIIILILGLVILGPGKLPQVGGAVGKTIREFRKASTESDAEEPGQDGEKTAAPVVTTVTASAPKTPAPAPTVPPTSSATAPVETSTGTAATASTPTKTEA